MSQIKILSSIVNVELKFPFLVSIEVQGPILSCCNHTYIHPPTHAYTHMLNTRKTHA